MNIQKEDDDDKRVRMDKKGVDGYSLSYGKSTRSTCAHCKKRLERKQLRINTKVIYPPLSNHSTSNTSSISSSSTQSSFINIDHSDVTQVATTHTNVEHKQLLGNLYPK